MKDLDERLVDLEDEYYDQLAKEYEMQREYELMCSFGCLCGSD